VPADGLFGPGTTPLGPGAGPWCAFQGGFACFVKASALRSKGAAGLSRSFCSRLSEFSKQPHRRRR